MIPVIFAVGILCSLFGWGCEPSGVLTHYGVVENVNLTMKESHIDVINKTEPVFIPVDICTVGYDCPRELEDEIKKEEKNLTSNEFDSLNKKLDRIIELLEGDAVIDEKNYYSKSSDFFIHNFDSELQKKFVYYSMQKRDFDNLVLSDNCSIDLSYKRYNDGSYSKGMNLVKCNKANIDFDRLSMFESMFEACVNSGERTKVYQTQTKSISFYCYDLIDEMEDFIRDNQSSLQLKPSVSEVRKN